MVNNDSSFRDASNWEASSKRSSGTQSLPKGVLEVLSNVPDAMDVMRSAGVDPLRNMREVLSNVPDAMDVMRSARIDPWKGVLEVLSNVPDAMDVMRSARIDPWKGVLEVLSNVPDAMDVMRSARIDPWKGVLEVLSNVPDAMDVMRSAGVDPLRNMREVLSNVPDAMDVMRSARIDPWKGALEVLSNVPDAMDVMRSAGVDPLRNMREVLSNVPDAMDVMRSARIDPWKGALEVLSNVGSIKDLSNFRSDFFESLNPYIEELIEELADHTDEDSLEEFDSADLTADRELLARIGDFTEKKLPGYSKKALMALDNLAVLIMASSIRTLIGTLILAFGWKGFVLGIVLEGGAKKLDEKQKKQLPPAKLHGLDISCPSCGALPDMWCIKIKGDDIGSPADAMHKPRYTSRD